VGEKGTLPYPLFVEMKISDTAMKSIIEVPQIDPPYDPVISSLDTYTKGHKTGYNKFTCTPMFIAALFPRAKL
jgi:hypothetical protein